jgi:vitamin B12/bleomycin/antimicrobial peptide transport system ATP-binding/permease protein
VTEHPISMRVVWQHFAQALRYFALSDVGSRARWMFIGLIAFVLAINGMNVINSYVGRDFMTAIEQRDKPEFMRQAFFYLCVFAASTLLSVTTRFTEERLALMWRERLNAISPTAATTASMYHTSSVTRTSEYPRMPGPSRAPRCHFS